MNELAAMPADLSAADRADDSPSAPRSRWPAALPALMSAGLALALYAVTLGGTYVFDDQYIVLRDPRVIDPSRWREIFTRDYFNGGVDNLYRPLVTLSYFAQWQLHGDRPWLFHLVNVLLHAAASAAVAELARRLTPTSVAHSVRLRAAALAGLLFAAHPIHVEAVANIVGRAELACTLAVVSAMVLFLVRPMTIGRALAIGACGLAAMLSKEQGLLLPLLLLALYPVRNALLPPPPPGRARDPGRAARSPERTPLMLLVLLMCWSVAGLVVLREQVLELRFWWDRFFLDPTMNPLVLSRGADRWLMPLALLGRYTQLLVAPLRLSPDYGGLTIGHAARLDDPYLWLGVATAVLWVVAVAYAAVRRHGPALFCLFALAVTYAIVSNFTTIIGTIFGERLMYLPSAFLLILVAWPLSRLPLRWLVTVAAVFLVPASARTVTYAARWSDPPELYRRAVADYPGSLRLYLVLAEELMRRGDGPGAEAALAQARQVMPDYPGVWFKSAVIALYLEKWDEADAFARRAQELDPRWTNGDIWIYIRDRRRPAADLQ